MDLNLSPEEERLLAKDDRAVVRTGAWLALIAACFLASIAAVGWQNFSWLKDGSWPLLTLSDALSVVAGGRWTVSWVGLQRIIDWILTLPLAGILFALGLLAMWLFTWGDDRPASEGLRTARMKRARRGASGSL